MDKILRINMSAEGGPQVSQTPLGDYAGLGGRAMTSAIVSKEVPPLCHPLGEDNKLVIAPGLLSGTIAAMSGRLSVGCKSPLTGGIKEANAGGQPSQMLARLGYAAVVLEGKPKDGALYKVLISPDGVKITPADGLKGLGNYDLVEKIKAEHGDKVSCMSIGQAGEMKLAAASIACTDMEMRPTRHAGRGGVGAVMGAKGVKVIVIDDSGAKMRPPKDPEKFKAANKEWVAGPEEEPHHRQGPAGLRHQRPDQRDQRGRRLPDPQLPVGPLRRLLGHQRRDPGRDRNRPRRARPPTAATAAASSGAPASSTTRTATT